MFAIIKIGAHQFTVAEGDTIKVSRLEGEEGKDITLDQVLLITKDEDVQVGQPFVKGAKITAKVVRHLNGEKVIAFKFRRRKNRARIRGHRQELTQLRITKITAN